MSAGHEPALRVALLQHGRSPAAAQYVQDLAGALHAAGHDPTVISSPLGAAEDAIDGLLRRRGFTGPLAHIPGTVASLASGGYQVAHAFSASDARAALAWQRFAACPVVFTCIEQIDRGTVADGRLRLSLLRSAVEDTDAVVAANEDVRSGLLRWLACDPPVIEAREAEAYERTYRRLLGDG